MNPTLKITSDGQLIVKSDQYVDPYSLYFRTVKSIGVAKKGRNYNKNKKKRDKLKKVKLE